ncbi:PREDICTED: uncharacterized protein LOC108361090 [Rhagoletis zephyria]|uniref:uncharacterized protein LOC108361090 n=1 Tax=Rhagoletis zephyria TaxID=28612 RepID=UPI0008116829|nr:PREDICTED: uncharacterized protein LOC108361090 [Rhagoletis zephyria]
MEVQRQVEDRVGISTQTSVGDVIATTGGRAVGVPNSPQRVASGHASVRVDAGSDSCNATVNDTEMQASNDDSSVDSPIDFESLDRGPKAGKAPTKFPVTTSSSKDPASEYRVQQGPTRQGRRALAKYKAAIRKTLLHGGNHTLTRKEREAIAKSREYFSKNPRFEPEDPNFVNCIEENVTKRFSESLLNDIEQNGSEKQLKIFEETTTMRFKKRKPQQYVGKERHVVHKRARPQTLVTTDDRPTCSKKAVKDPEVAKQDFIVALIDRSHPGGEITAEQWKQVDAKILETIVMWVKAEPEEPTPSFDGSGWCKGVKILKCNDEYTMQWITKVVRELDGLWDGAQLAVVAKEDIPNLPRAKVRVPSTIKPEVALLLLQRQNTDIPTENWKVIHQGEPDANGLDLILQINKEAEDKLYARFGKMFLGTDSVYLKLKRRHPEDGNVNTLDDEELEQDFGT